MSCFVLILKLFFFILIIYHIFLFFLIVLNKLFHPLSDLINNYSDCDINTINYYYEGICPNTRRKLKLPRNLLIEKIAYCLMIFLQQEEIYNYEGKMYGVLLVENNNNQLGVIKAFSGLLNGKSNVQGWIPPIPGRKIIALAENFTLVKLEEIKQEIINLENLPTKEEYYHLLSQYESIRQELNIKHQKRKEARDEIRKLLGDNISQEIIEKLETESRLDGIEKRNLKRHWQSILQPLKNKILAFGDRINQLKQERKQLSRQLQAQMQTAYTLSNFAGNTLNLSTLTGKSFIPTGTGDCCAPKLLHYAATNNLKPLAMAEFWWGENSVSGDKIKGNFYGACVERCQPLMGFLLSGLRTNINAINKCDIPIIYEDDYILVVNKPAGLLSVPGRDSNNFDSVESRLQQLYLNKLNIKAVHRLDLDTSGLLILAKNRETYIFLKQQFADKQVKKVYQAILQGKVTRFQGIINLPLWSNPNNRPLQEVNWEKGKPSITHFEVMDFADNYTRMLFKPITGRSHQIRVHAASEQGLGIAILGDRLYNKSNNGDRLHLHACELEFKHPYTDRILHLSIDTPF